MYRFLAIDPSTTVMGLVVFSNGQPVTVQTVEQQGPDTVHRIRFMLDAVNDLVLADGRVTDIACEVWGGPRNPTGQTLIKGLKDLAARLAMPWHPYTSNQVVGAVAPRGWRTRTTDQRKWAMYHGVRAMFPNVANIYTVQDEYDATAVGVAHLAKIHETEIAT